MKAMARLTILSFWTILAMPTSGTTMEATNFPRVDLVVGNWIEVSQKTNKEPLACFTFTQDLQAQILVRHGRTPRRGGPRYWNLRDDLIVVYSPRSPRAMYFDSEHRAIPLDISTTQRPAAVVFTSPFGSSLPRLRLTIKEVLPDKIRVLIEEAADGQFKLTSETLFEGRPWKQLCPDA